MTKNTYIDKYHYSGCGIEFDRGSIHSFPGVGFGQNIKIFGADMSSSVHVDNKGKYILILRSGPTKRAFINCTIKGKDSKVLAAPLCLENI